MNTTQKTAALLASMLVLALAGCGKAPVEASATATPVLVMTISNSSSNSGSERRLPGFVTSRYQADLGFQVPGRVGERLVEVGTTVKKGQPLLRLQSTDYVQGLSAAEDQLRAARVDAQQSTTDAKRFASLVQSGAVSEADQQGQQARADAAQARLNLAERQVTLARNRLAYTTLNAPFDGTVTGLRAEVGQVVAEGMPVVMIAREDTPEVTVDVPEDLVGKLPSGNMSARLTGSEHLPLTVRLREIEPSASMPLRSYRARFSIVNHDKSTQKLVRLGKSAEVVISSGNTSTQAQGLTLPAGSIISQGDAAFVWVISNEQSTLLKKPVKVAKMVNEGVVVTGLEQSEKVVVAGTEKLKEGQQVRAIERSGTAFEPDMRSGAVR